MNDWLSEYSRSETGRALARISAAHQLPDIAVAELRSEG
jgi:hypothetical protein